MLKPRFDHSQQPELRFVGAISYFTDQQRIHLALDGIASDRAADNLSGTLSIELWALDTSYHGGLFQGECLAATQIGELWGNHWLADCDYDLIYQAPAGNARHLCLMLREWNGVAFETCDYRNFSHGLNTAEPRLKVVQAVAGADIIQLETTKKSKPTAASKATANNTKLCVNTASEKELGAIKGLSKKVARAIVEARPFSSMDELQKVKGLGRKTLEKLRDSLHV